jgi:hypothetical protein
MSKSQRAIAYFKTEFDVKLGLRPLINSGF